MPMPFFSVPLEVPYVYIPNPSVSFLPAQTPRTSLLTHSDQQKWGTGAVRPEQGILKLRKEMGTFGNLRPCNFAAPSLVESSPLKADICRGVDFNIIRELTGGIYFGERKEDDGSGYAMDTEPYSREEIERIIRLAANLALQHNPPLPVWSLDKANVLATSRLWRKVVTEVMEKEYPQVSIGHHLIDSAAMLMIKDPRKLNGIVVTSNLFGDIISDEASVIPGSLGLLPSASLSGIPDGKSRVNGIYEPIHGKCSVISIAYCQSWFWPWLTGTHRLCPRYCWQGHRQPHCYYPVCCHDDAVLLQHDRRSSRH
jgi:3-isopropylmalate dehydrogenase